MYVILFFEQGNWCAGGRGRGAEGPEADDATRVSARIESAGGVLLAQQPGVPAFVQGPSPSAR